MRGMSETYLQAICAALLNIISLQELADGAALSVLPDGRTTAASGLAVVPASLTARQARERGLLTTGTYGGRSSISSASASLTSSLGNKLRRRFRTNGSTLFRRTWRLRATPAGRRYWAHTASPLRTSVNGFSSWATPNTMDHRASRNWEERKKAGGCANLKDQVTLLANRGTRTASDEKDWLELRTIRGQPKSQVPLEGSGPMPNGSAAGMKRTAQLNPTFSLWLMGYAIEWASCGALATPSCRKRRKRSSGRV